MVPRDDIWAGDTCLVCQSKHANGEEKKLHEEDASHSKELQVLAPSTVDSLLFERYSRANTTVAGLDCICELKFSWATQRFWICTVCHVSGCSLDSADFHVYSSQHKRNYVCVHHADQFDEMCAELEKCAPNERSDVEYRFVQKLLYDGKCLSQTDVYLLEGRRRQWAYTRLGLEDVQPPAEYILEPISDAHQIVQCLICGDSFFAYEKAEELQVSWNTHLSSNYHQKCRMMLTLLEEERLEERSGLPEYCYEKTESTFNQFNGAYYGSTCGFEFLVDFLESKECFCTLCFCLISNSEATEHFSSEHHIERFARRFNPSKLLSAEYMKVDERHEILIEAVAKRGKSEKHKMFKDTIPQLLRRFAFVDKRAFATMSVQHVFIGSEKAAWCEECTQYIKIVNNDSWQNHIMEEEHFDFSTKKAMYYIDTENLVPNSSSLPALKRAAKGWEDKFVVALGRSVVTQDHCYYGLQYIVRDELSRLSICICCHFVTNYEEDDIMSIHVRSLDHLMRIMHLTNKKFLAVLWKCKTLDKQKACLLDFLKHCKLDSVVDSPIVYDPMSALNANCYGKVSNWLLELSKLPPETREMSLASLKLSDFEHDRVPLNVAMRSANVEFRHIESVIVMFCQFSGCIYSNCSTNNND